MLVIVLFLKKKLKCLLLSFITLFFNLAINAAMDRL